MNRRVIATIIGVVALVMSARGAFQSQWQTYFAYNSVDLIAVTEDKTYALANGVIFSVDKKLETLTKYDSRDGLHGTEVSYLMYDEVRKQLLILYADGKMDILRNGTMHYISDLYNKRMTSSKTCNNITIEGNKAYMSMEFGILVFDLERYEFKDAYYIGDEAAEVQVQDVMLYGDSIYAKTADGVYSAALKDKLVDFRYWNANVTPPTSFDTNKGKNITDTNGDVWKAMGSQGVYRKVVTGEESYYLPDGPCTNLPYFMTVDRGRLFVVPGGRWASQYLRNGNVMIYDGDRWTNITEDAIRQKTGKRAMDFMEVAVDPTDGDHFWVSSYGTGLYEFQNYEVLNRYTATNSALAAVIPTSPDTYTRVSGLTYDSENRLWVTVSGVSDTALVAFMPDGSQRCVMMQKEDGSPWESPTFGRVLADSHRPHCKWMIACRSNTSLLMHNDGGTTFDMSDDQTAIRSEWYDQDIQPIKPDFLYTIAQAENGDIWVGSSAGPIIIDHDVDYLTSPSCRRLRITMSDGTYLLESDQVNAFAFDGKQQIWIGTQTAGVYVLNDSATQILAHYTSDDTPMPSNTILSLAYDDMHDLMFIGTGAGLVSCKLTQDTSTNLIDTSEDAWTYGSMRQWKAHFAYSEIDEVASMGDKVYALSGGALFSVNTLTEEIEYYNRLTGLTSSGINHICYNPTLGKLLIMYENGYWDILSSNGDVHNVADLYLKSLNGSKAANDVLMVGDKAYIAMPFGVVVLDMSRREVKETCYIGYNAAEVDVQYLALLGDTICAATTSRLYMANINDNLADYTNWNSLSFPSGKTLSGMESFNNTICILRNDSLLYSLSNDNTLDLEKGKCVWNMHSMGASMMKLCKIDDRLFALPTEFSAVREIQKDFSVTSFVQYGSVYDMTKNGSAYWLGTESHGLVRVQDGNAQEFHPDGPLSNISYRLKSFGDRLYMLAGGRWASQYLRPGMIMYYENGHWTNISNAELVSATAGLPLYDCMNVAQDPNDKDHYFVTTYGTGMIEMRGTSLVKQYLSTNSPLGTAVASNPNSYTRTDGAIYDEDGNLWVLNMSDDVKNIHVISPSGQWSSFNLQDLSGKRVTMNTTGEMLIDNRNSEWKWIPLPRDPALVLFQDNGTPSDPSDDKAISRKTWVNQQGKTVAPTYIYSIAQDNDNALWVGTNEGLFVIPASVNFMTSDACEQIILARDDGSGLGDYLLGSEQINCIAVDGNNRKWIGTATSGVYLMSADGQETEVHFTTDNSLLPSDNVLSIAILESTGEVFIGTSSGLVSYMSDATEAFDSFDNLYAYPNPVRPTYKGYITIKGLMSDTEVRITDSEGNLVALLQGTGGEVVWDGTNTIGKRVASGVYTAICNTTDGSHHAAVKILIMN